MPRCRRLVFGLLCTFALVRMRPGRDRTSVLSMRGLPNSGELTASINPLFGHGIGMVGKGGGVSECWIAAAKNSAMMVKTKTATASAHGTPGPGSLWWKGW